MLYAKVLSPVLASIFLQETVSNARQTKNTRAGRRLCEIARGFESVDEVALRLERGVVGHEAAGRDGRAILVEARVKRVAPAAHAAVVVAHRLRHEHVQVLLEVGR